jgi:hypothetical protein
MPGRTLDSGLFPSRFGWLFEARIELCVRHTQHGLSPLPRHARQVEGERSVAKVLTNAMRSFTDASVGKLPQRLCWARHPGCLQHRQSMANPQTSPRLLT